MIAGDAVAVTATRQRGAAAARASEDIVLGFAMTLRMHPTL